MFNKRYLLTAVLYVLTCISAHVSAQDLAANLSSSSVAEHEKDEGKIEIKIAGKLLKIAYADEPLERQLGLMYRKKMCDDCGMLFKFDSIRHASIWMKNTYIPLDLAYITEQGEIVDIQALKPHDLTSVKSPIPVLYALEMNQGWFAENKVKVGDSIQRLP